jgi:hypothetical protein
MFFLSFGMYVVAEGVKKKVKSSAKKEFIRE